MAWTRGNTGTDKEPFFLWVHYQDPHGPYTPPEALLPPGEHGFWFSHEQDLHDELIRVPLIIMVPGQHPERLTARACHIDLFPTLMALAGQESLNGYRGLNLLDPSALETTRGIYSETNHLVTKRALRSLVLGPYKVIRSLKGETPPLLFDINRDPGETENLFASRPEVAKAMMRRLKDHERLARSGKQSTPQKWSAEDERILKSLGYTGK